MGAAVVFAGANGWLLTPMTPRERCTSIACDANESAKTGFGRRAGNNLPGMHKNAELIFDKYCTPLIKPGSLVLEVGAGMKWKKWSPYWKSATARGWDYRRCDFGNYGSEEPDFIRQPSEYKIDAPDNTFDAVIASQVLEHVRLPERWTPELARITKRGGIVALVAPLNWLPHTRVDCWRPLAAGMRAILEHAGLECVVACSENLDKSGVNRGNCWGGADPVDTVGIGRKRI